MNAPYNIFILTTERLCQSLCYRHQFTPQNLEESPPYSVWSGSSRWTIDMAMVAGSLRIAKVQTIFHGRLICLVDKQSDDASCFRYFMHIADDVIKFLPLDYNQDLLSRCSKTRTWVWCRGRCWIQAVMSTPSRTLGETCSSAPGSARLEPCSGDSSNLVPHAFWKFDWYVNSEILRRLTINLNLSESRKWEVKAGRSKF